MKIKAPVVSKFSTEKCPGMNLVDFQQGITIVNTCRNSFRIAERQKITLLKTNPLCMCLENTENGNTDLRGKEAEIN